VTLELHCLACGAPFKPHAAFCASCGRRRGLVDHGVTFVIWFYLALLALNVIALIAGRLDASPFHVTAFATLAMAAATLAVAATRTPLIAAPYRRAGFSPIGYALILLAAPAILLAVDAYVDLIVRAFDLTRRNDLSDLDGRSLPSILLLIAIAPPLIEELAFRGLMFGALARTLRRSEIYLLSSFAFAILHLSIPSLLTHLPLGLYFCWLRERSGSLWPSTFAHFCHNLGVTILVFRSWP
jgi:membrane protease YdiL (CAAX protease family)